MTYSATLALPRLGKPCTATPCQTTPDRDTSRLNITGGR